VSSVRAVSASLDIHVGTTERLLDERFSLSTTTTTNDVHVAGSPRFLATVNRLQASL